MKVVFIGMPASGKSTCAKALATICKLSSYDTDTIISQKYSMSVSDIIDNNGEKYFRKLESNVIDDLSKLEMGIISLGGGAILSDSNMQVLQDWTIVLLECSLSIIYQRLQQPNNIRPLLRDATFKQLNQLYILRRPLYNKYADIIVDSASFDINKTTLLAIKGLNEYYQKRLIHN